MTEFLCIFLGSGAVQRKLEKNTQEGEGCQSNQATTPPFAGHQSLTTCTFVVQVPSPGFLTLNCLSKNIRLVDVECILTEYSIRPDTTLHERNRMNPWQPMYPEMSGAFSSMWEAIWEIDCNKIATFLLPKGYRLYSDEVFRLGHFDH